MTAGSWAVTLEKGATFLETLTFKAAGALMDLTGYSASLSLWISGGDPNAPDIALTPGSGLTLGGVAGTIAVEISEAAILALTSHDLKGDLFITPPSGKPIKICTITAKVVDR